MIHRHTAEKGKCLYGQYSHPAGQDSGLASSIYRLLSAKQAGVLVSRVGNYPGIADAESVRHWVKL